MVARLLAEHSANAGHLGGVFLSGMFWFNGYGTPSKSIDIGIARMKTAAKRVTTDWQLEDYVEYETDDLMMAGQYLMNALAGSDTALYNLIRLRKRLQYGKICMSNRKGIEKCIQGNDGWNALLIELASAIGDSEPGSVQEVTKMCGQNI